MADFSREAIIFFTHIWNPTIGARVDKLLREKPENADLFVMADQTTGRLTADDMPRGVGLRGVWGTRPATGGLDSASQ